MATVPRQSIDRILEAPAPAADTRPPRADLPARSSRPPTSISAPAARVAAIIVTWNRKAAVDAVLSALSRQQHPLGRLDVVVVDNASTDGTSDLIRERWRPDLVVDNPTPRAHEPQFSTPGRTGPNTAGFASLTLVRNAHNHGGCGGFNTGLAYLEQRLDAPETPLDYAWLVDDDVDLPPTALAQLVRTAESDPRIGLVGSRTVDFDRRDTTIETTIYFDAESGTMAPDPAPGHPMAESHRAWAQSAGGTRGALPFTGLRDVDVVSACSLLARWSAVKRVGFWDHRYFIYCDDADWCLRFARSGYRVVLDLDAVVYHTYWLAKLTPARAYYAARNLVWMMEKVVPRARLRRAVARRLGALLRDARKAMTHARLFHAEIIRRTADDIVRARGGRLDNEGPPFEPIFSALDRARALRRTATVLVMCSHPESTAWAEDFRARLAADLRSRDRAADMPQLVYVCRDHIPVPAQPHPLARPAPIVRFAPNRRSKWQAQRRFLLNPPAAVVIFDQSNELPLIRGSRNIHIDRRRPGMAQFERDGFLPRAHFMARWALTALRCTLYVAFLRGPRPAAPGLEKYG